MLMFWDATLLRYVNASNPQPRELGFESWAAVSNFGQVGSLCIQLTNEYLVVDSGVYVCSNCLLALIADGWMITKEIEMAAS